MENQHVEQESSCSNTNSAVQVHSNHVTRSNGSTVGVGATNTDRRSVGTCYVIAMPPCTEQYIRTIVMAPFAHEDNTLTRLWALFL